ncbi:Holliday junction branch migration protein RuvA [Candidatus Aerophobetes bacterium]|uniref:Holliday junction branch migration complex subunit RuvA n=1 Tax=Aerophobetes bacterium TaxID=2030807 RepID=A0A662DCQ3_UNCAE|nr:MAG: Holliday junction branch migration protein RuvA [Candidatus Aerophobetes bacterium]
MIYYLEGILKEKNPSFIVLEVKGVGYKINIPFSIFEDLPSLDQKIKIYTYLHVKENEIALYGFLKPEDREFFLHLISLSSIGPRSALRMLSRISPGDFKKAIKEKDLIKLTHIPGIGKKTAQRLILELGEDLKQEPILVEENKLIQEGIEALISLGYSKYQAREAIDKVIKQGKIKNNLTYLIKEALRYV